MPHTHWQTSKGNSNYTKRLHVFTSKRQLAKAPRGQEERQMRRPWGDERPLLELQEEGLSVGPRVLHQGNTGSPDSILKPLNTVGMSCVSLCFGSSDAPISGLRAEALGARAGLPSAPAPGRPAAAAQHLF